MSLTRVRSSVISKVRVFKAASYSAATMLCTDALPSAAAAFGMSSDVDEKLSSRIGLLGELSAECSGMVEALLVKGITACASTSNAGEISLL